jgi:methylmalonyl-CoA mutase
LNYLIVAKTSSLNPHQEKVNMLIQHTTEAISGFISASDGIIIAPIQTDNIHLDRRMARNIFHLLQEESYLSLVDDASNGSYFIENYTHQIAKKIHSIKI